MDTVRASVASQSAALSAAADEILNQPKVEPHRYVPLSAAEAVLRYWSDFIPSWAGAISIDLLPVVLVLVLMIVHDAMRRETGSLEEAETITGGRNAALAGALSQADRKAAGRGAGRRSNRRWSPVTTAPPPAEPEPPAVVETAERPRSADATVTPLGVPRKRT